MSGKSRNILDNIHWYGPVVAKADRCKKPQIFSINLWISSSASNPEIKYVFLKTSRLKSQQQIQCEGGEIILQLRAIHLMVFKSAPIKLICGNLWKIWATNCFKNSSMQALCSLCKIKQAAIVYLKNLILRKLTPQPYFIVPVKENWLSDLIEFLTKPLHV